MITKEDVIHFYKKYKENLKKEEQVKADLMHAESQEEWVEKLKQKHRMTRQLYIENEAMLNLYVRPLIEGRAELTADAAKAFVDQIRLAWNEGFEDNLSMLEMAEALVSYFRENGPLEYYIWDMSLMGTFYNCCSEIEDGRRGYEYFEQVCQLKDHYFEIDDFEDRKRLIYAFYNRPIVQVNFLLEEENKLSWNLDQALAFYNDPKVLALDGGRFDFEGLIEELNYDVFGNYILSHTRENSKRWILERAESVLGRYYRQELAKDSNPYAMPDEIYCYYKKTLFFLGKISCTEFLDDYKKFCDYSLANDKLEHPDGFWESRLFQVAVNHLPGILQCLNLYGDEYQGNPDLRKRCVEDYLKILKKIPRIGNSKFVNDVIRRSLYGFMGLLTAEDMESDVLINVMLNRDEITLIHSMMVGQIAALLLNEVIECRPELLIGTLGCTNLVEVLEKREEISAFVSQAAKIFDIGKLKDADIVNKQSRQLTTKELKRIYMHPEAGAEIVKKIPLLSKFQNIALGHHKSWNGVMGYPESFDNTVSKDRFLIELIHLSDCLDAATDFIGRSYKETKSLEECLAELAEGKGTMYSPDLVTLIEEDEALQKKLTELLNEGRIHTYYEVYGIVLEEENDWYAQLNPKTEIEENDTEQLINILHESNCENSGFVRAMVRQSLLTLYVDLRSGSYHVFSRGEGSLFAALPDGKYQNFLTRQLGQAAFPKDWEKMEYQLNLSEITHRLVRNSGNYECEMRLLMDKQYRWVRLQFMKIDENNIIPRTMALVITDVQDNHSRSDQMESVLKNAYQAAMEANKAKSIFLSSMSHDIRTPMNGIMGMTRIAMEHLDDRERVEDCLKKIDESSRHLLELINEVLDMSRIESGNEILHEEPVQMGELIESVVDMCRPDAAQSHQQMLIQIDAVRDDCVMADPVRLRQIFTNILSNSVKYTPEGGQVCLRASKLSEDEVTGNCYQFEFQDNGIGMSMQFQKKLFEPFAREDNSMTNEKQGTGLGLAIVKAMITMMGGTIRVNSTQGLGTTFTVTLQFLQAEKTVMKTDEASEDWRFDGHRILLAEDNALNREIACEFLRERGLIVETAENGEEAVRLFERSHKGYYELILMDIQMPVMNGYEAAETIRKLDGDYSDNIPIIALTANIFQDDVMKAMESGMNEHLAKPIDMREMGCVLNKWLKK